MDKRLSAEEFKNIFVEYATIEWMKQAGLDPSDPNTNPRELDESDETSQLVAWKLTAEEAYTFFIDTLSTVTAKGYEIGGDTDEHSEDLLQDFREDSLDGVSKTFLKPPTAKKKAVFKSSTVFIFAQTDPGIPLFVGDIREWLSEIDSLNIPDTTEVEGEIFLSYDKEFVTGERSECLKCGDREDVLITNHECDKEELK
jgi:hypothetical protein